MSVICFVSSQSGASEWDSASALAWASEFNLNLLNSGKEIASVCCLSEGDLISFTAHIFTLFDCSLSLKGARFAHIFAQMQPVAAAAATTKLLTNTNAWWARGWDPASLRGRSFGFKHQKAYHEQTSSRNRSFNGSSELVKITYQ